MNGKIGVFDSGLGGLSILKELRKLLPNEDYLFYEDSINNPYGTKNEDELFLISSKIVDYLLDNNCKIIVIACNTATTSCMKRLREAYPDTIFVGTVPAIKVAYDNNYKNTIILSTPYTTKSKRVEASFTSKLLATVNPNIAVWDSNVLSHLDNVKVPYSLKDKDEQIKRTVDSYKNLINTINALKNNEGKMFIEVFDKTLESVKLESTYPLSKVTSTKKIDLVLWSLGKKPKEKSIKKY